jgi:hypothetical protein
VSAEVNQQLSKALRRSKIVFMASVCVWTGLVGINNVMDYRAIKLKNSVGPFTTPSNCKPRPRTRNAREVARQTMRQQEPRCLMLKSVPACYGTTRPIRRSTSLVISAISASGTAERSANSLNLDNPPVTSRRISIGLAIPQRRAMSMTVARESM